MATFFLGAAIGCVAGGAGCFAAGMGTVIVAQLAIFAAGGM